jgi:hypothetical protein
MNNTAIIKPQWSPLTIALMVLGFIVFWPIGIAVLAYILWGEMFGGSADKAQAFINGRREWAQNRQGWRNQSCGSGRGGRGPSSGNAAFDDYRQEQLKRLEEERSRLDAEIEAFHEHMRNLRMARDREEFDRFMHDRNSGQRQGYNEGEQTNGPQGGPSY